MDFKDYGFKPADVVKGLNEYYEKRKKGVYGTFIVRTGTDRLGETSYMNPDVYVKEAINWLREEHGIFYTPGMKLEDPVDPDIFDTPRYKFLSILSSELGFRSIVGPGNAEKMEKDILRVVRHRNERAKKDADDRHEFLRKLGCELGIKYPAVKPGSEENTEADILERIEKLKEGNWPCENDNAFAKHMKKQFPKECGKWNVVPLEEGSVHDWVQYIFEVLDDWRKRALNDEKERDTVYEALGLNPADDDVYDVTNSIKKLREDRAKYKGMLNTTYGASCGGAADNVLPCYRDTCNNPKAVRERDAAKDALAELRTKIREVYCEIFNCEFWADCGYIAALNNILEDYKFQKKLKEKAEEKAASNKMELMKCREYILTVYREIFDCSNGDPEGSDEETLEDILTEYRWVVKAYDAASSMYGSAVKLLGEYLTEAKDIALKWNSSYADVRRLLGVSADADAGEMVGALNKLVCDYETCDRLRKNWYDRYESEHIRANGEHKRAEKYVGEIAALETKVASLERSLTAATNEQVGMDAFRKECRKLRDEKDKVIKALGQDIWDDCLK